MEKILVIDFGGQYNQLVARRVRECNVYCEIYSYRTGIEAIKSTLERAPPELSADIIDHGITLTGGGALLKGFDKLVNIETGMPVHVAENPLDCVAMGTGMVLDKLSELKDILTDESRM